MKSSLERWLEGQKPLWDDSFGSYPLETVWVDGVEWWVDVLDDGTAITYCPDL